MKIMNKKGVLGIDTVKAFIVLILVIAVIAIAMFVALTAIVDNNTDLNTRTLSGNRFNNETITLNDTSQSPATVASLTSVVLTDVTVTNASNGVLIGATNYTESAGAFISAAALFNDTEVNISANYAHNVDGDSVSVMNNVTSGVTDFFDNIPTVFTILGAVIIILAVVLILFAVGRFTQGGERL